MQEILGGQNEKRIDGFERTSCDSLIHFDGTGLASYYAVLNK